MNPLLKMAILTLFLMACQPQQKADELTSVEALLQDRTATAYLKAERFEDALNLYVDMLEHEPNKPQIHSNIGVIMAQIQKNDEALKSLQHALQLAEQQKDLASLFATNYNLGVFYGSQKKIDEALSHYQAALDIVPTSKEAKTNIELLTQSQNKSGKGEGDKKDQDKDQKGDDSKDSQGEQKKDDKKDQKPQDDKKDKEGKDKDGKDKEKEQEKKKPDEKGSAKYKPRPYQGDQLSEGDVKKILGELRNQEQKIRANFDKKEQKDAGHEKDW